MICRWLALLTFRSELVGSTVAKRILGGYSKLGVGTLKVEEEGRLAQVQSYGRNWVDAPHSFTGVSNVGAIMAQDRSPIVEICLTGRLRLLTSLHQADSKPCCLDDLSNFLIGYAVHKPMQMPSSSPFLILL
jgi:hypothetical protein